MLGYMTAEALQLTIDTGQAHYWSRSREALWRKGEHSGFVHRVAAILVDDDQDALLLRVHLEGPGSCHVGYRSCFYRELRPDSDREPCLTFIEPSRAFDADAVYDGLPNPTRL